MSSPPSPLSSALPAGPGAAAAHSHPHPAPMPRAYTIMAAGAAKGKTALLRLLLDTAELPPKPQPAATSASFSRTAPPASSASSSALSLSGLQPASHPYPDPTPENIARFVHGAASRTTHVRTCSVEVLLPADRQRRRSHVHPSENNIQIQDSQTVLLNLVDTPSLDITDAAALERSLAEVLAFVEARFAESIDDEQKARTGDHHVHLCLYLLDPDTIVPLPVSTPPSPIIVPSISSPPPPLASVASGLPSVVQSQSHPQSQHLPASNSQLSHLTLPPPPSATPSRPHSHSRSGSLTASSNQTAPTKDTLLLPSPGHSPSTPGSGTATATRGGAEASNANDTPTGPPAASPTAGSHTNVQEETPRGSASVSVSALVSASENGSGSTSGGGLSPPNTHAAHAQGQHAQDNAHSSAALPSVSVTNVNSKANQVPSVRSPNGSAKSGTTEEGMSGVKAGTVAKAGSSVGVTETESALTTGVIVGGSQTPANSAPPSTSVPHVSVLPRLPLNPPHLPPLEIAAIKALSARTNVLPVLARADTIGAARLAAIKRAVRADLAAAGIGFGIFDAGPGSGEDLCYAGYGLDDSGESDENEVAVAENGEVKMEVDFLPLPASTLADASLKDGKKQTKTGNFPPIRIPRLPHAILTPDIYAHSEGIQLDLFDLSVVGFPEQDVDGVLGTESFEDLVRKYTPPSPTSFSPSPTSSPPPRSPNERAEKSKSVSPTAATPVRAESRPLSAGPQAQTDGEEMAKELENSEELKDAEKENTSTRDVQNVDVDAMDTETISQAKAGDNGIEKSGSRSPSRTSDVPIDIDKEVENSATSTSIPDPEQSKSVFTSQREKSKSPSPVVSESSQSALVAKPSKREPERKSGKNGLVKGRFVRRYRWGIIDVLDPTHCDFIPLRQAVFHHMQPLRTYTREYLFEKFRVEIHHQRQHLAASSLRPSSAHTLGIAASSPAYSSTTTYAAGSPTRGTPGYPFPIVNSFNGVTAPPYSSVATPVSATGSGVSPRLATLLSPNVDPVKDRERARSGERERDALWEREKEREREQRERERDRARERDRRLELFPAPAQSYPPQRTALSASATSPGLAPVAPLGAPTTGRLSSSSSRERERLEREREMARNRERRSALPPLANVAAAQQAVAPLPPLSAVSAGTVTSPMNGREYVREREYYSRDRVYDRERERERERQRELERERQREYRARRATIGVRDEYELERGYEYGGYERPSALPPPGIAPSRSYRDRAREEYTEPYLSDEEREEMEKYRRERYNVPPLAVRELERGREKISERRPITDVSPREREYERERERELLAPRPVSSSGLGLGIAARGRDAISQRLPNANSGTTSASTSDPPSALLVPLSAHPSTHASPSSAYPQTPASAYPRTHSFTHHATRGDVPGVYEKSGHVSGSTSGASSVTGGSSMHHMQHRHHGGGHVLGPVQPDSEFDREMLREREVELEIERAAREREIEKQREQRERERERERASGYGLRSTTETRPMGVDYAGRPVVIEEDVHARLRTKKITVACDFCRSRKLKCDGGRPSCSQCIKRQHPCDYKAHTRRRGGAAARASQVQGQTTQEHTHSEGEEDAVGELDAEYDAASGAEDGVHASVIAHGANGSGIRHTGAMDRRPGSGTSTGPMTSRRSSNVDLMIAETLQSPRSVAREQDREREREHERQMERDYAYAAASHAHPPHRTHSHPNGHPYAGQLAPPPFSGANAPGGGSASAPVHGPVTSPGGQRALTTNMQLLAPAQSPTGVIALGGMTPAEQAVAASATGRKRGGPKLSRIASNYGPKVVACNFCRARKTKCDGQHPTCQSCARRSLPCSYVNEGAPGRGRKPGQTYKHLKDQKGKETQTDLTKFAKDQPQYLPPASGAPGPGSAGKGDTNGHSEGDGDDAVEGSGEETANPASSSSRSIKRNLMDEDASDSGKKRLRMDEEARRVDISASA